METNEQYKKLCKLGEQLLLILDEDPRRDGLRDTPQRFAKHWQEFLNYDAGKIETTFESISVDQMVAVSKIRVWSLCEHHLLPFWCDLSVGYITKAKVLGLSKIPRICQRHAHRLQLQERLVDDIATDLSRLTESPDVAVVGVGLHTCMAMRGIKSDSFMTSSVMRGRFKSNHHTRMEFLSLCQTSSSK
jgi:GTP cyclohydrolase I